MSPDEHEVMSLIITDRHYVHVKTWREAGEWWAHVVVDGDLKAHESLGRDTPVQPLQFLPVPVKKNKRRKR
jgi:hypothetical protein